MAERSSLNQSIQIGVESTPGTAVTAARRLGSIGIEPNIETDIQQYRPTGRKHRALAVLGKEWTTSRITGIGTYTELQYMLASVVDTPTITTPGGATSARQWVFESDNDADDAPKTYTVQHGSSVRADEFAYGIVTDFGMSFDRSAVNVTGSMMGQEISDGVTLDTVSAEADLIPIAPRQVSVYLDDTAAELGDTKLTRAISVEFNIANRYAPVWVLDAAQNPYVAHVETEPDVTVGLKLQANSEGMGLLTALRADTIKFLRIEATGGTDSIEGGQDYTFQADFAVRISGTPGFTDEDGVYGFEWQFVAAYDPTWTKTYSFLMKNAATAL